MARVVLEGVSKIFRSPKKEPVHAVRELSLSIEDGELLVVVGPSGSGKSTLLRMIAGLEKVSSGMVSIDGQQVNEIDPKDRDVAMVFQNHALYPHMTVFENMALGLKLRKVPKAEIQQRVRETAELLHIADYLDRLPAALSGGECQRVALGRAIVRRPKVFLLDEPLSNLDARLRRQMRLELARLHDQLKITMVYVTHDQTEAMTLGDRIAVMRAGTIQQIADPMTIYRKPASMFVAEFMGALSMNFFHGRLQMKDGKLAFREQTGSGGTVTAGWGVIVEHSSKSLSRFMDRNVILGIRPEDIEVRAEVKKGNLDFADHYGEAVVEAVEPTGPETFLHLTTGNHLFVARVQQDGLWTVGQRVLVQLNPDKLSWFDLKSKMSLEGIP